MVAKLHIFLGFMSYELTVWVWSREEGVKPLSGILPDVFQELNLQMPSTSLQLIEAHKQAAGLLCWTSLAVICKTCSIGSAHQQLSSLSLSCPV